MPPLFSVEPLPYSWKKKIRAEGRDELERHRAESQWIVAARPLCHLQYPVAHVPLGAKWPLLLVLKQAVGVCIASSPNSDLEAFSHNLAHGSFAPLAFQPSAMTNCANQRFLSY
ncbi:hypothetical protein RHGRI_014046 [Rhododendron griersonianum]|uniref:Uncharacterized protein n=1 Tax=Rhododendron griersonianum TaxID=479676 RepID=A0AAV6K7W5_9ERIC|nr:hypothetical protein RHGRI_014046 [Rhododendron griersonianum]